MGAYYSTYLTPVQNSLENDVNHIYGWLCDKPDERDHKKNIIVSNVILDGTVKRVDLREKCPNVYVQGQLGSCTANAICANYAYVYMKEHNLSAKNALDFSRLFVYWYERDMEGTVNVDSGAYIRDGIKVVHDNGVPVEEFWKYDIEKFREKPDDNAVQMAQHHVSFEYARIDRDLNQMKQYLLNGNPFVFGFLVYESFESFETTKTGHMKMPKSGEKLLGGHAVMAVGFDDDQKTFIVRNSWGSSWGHKGYFYMPYDYMMGQAESDQSPYTSDFWAIESTKDSSDPLNMPNTQIV